MDIEGTLSRGRLSGHALSCSINLYKAHVLSAALSRYGRRTSACISQDVVLSMGATVPDPRETGAIWSCAIREADCAWQTKCEWNRK